MNDELIEQVARAICVEDGQDWDALSDSYNGRQRQYDYKRFAKAAMQPHIAAEREDAARRALEAAVVEVYSECAVAEMIAPIIRAIDPAQFREAGNG